MSENETVDLSSLRINRSDPPASGKPKSRLPYRLALGGLVLVAATVVYFSVQKAIDPTIDVQLVTVTLSSPSQANAVLTASGYVVAQRKAAVASKATGRLEYLGVVEGDKVKKDEVIARLENSDMRAQYDQAIANVKVNQADLQDALRSRDRLKTLLEKGLATQADFDAAQGRYERVLASIDVAKAMVAAAQVALENTLIRAPFDGTVLTKNADVGEMVAPMAASVSSRSAVVTIADMSSLQVETDVSESNIERITVNQPCEITLDAYPDVRYQGSVAKIVPTADRAKATVMVKVAFRSYDSKVLPEMSAKVLFLTGEVSSSQPMVKPILTVSATAVVTRGDQHTVFMVRDNHAVETPVSVGRDLGSLVEIRSGVSAGDRVITKVPADLHDGSPVRVK
jgi:HlyD family secretion protein